MPWTEGETQVSNTVSRADAIRLIEQKARDNGISGAFKVFQKSASGNWTEIITQSMLPEQVNMDEIRVSAVYDQATAWRV